MSDPVLHLKGIEKAFPGVDGAVPILRGIDLDLAAGESLALTGESGSGKSTLLHIAGGLDAADRGIVRVAGQDVGAMDDAARAALRRRDVAVIFQQFNLIPSLSAGDNIAFQARLGGGEDAALIDELTGRLGLGEHLAKYPENLSGGQQQRVAIARALAARPRLLLADEPTGNLDEATAEAVLGELVSLVAQTGAALMVVTHSPNVAARMDRRVHLRAGRLA